MPIIIDGNAVLHGHSLARERADAHLVCMVLFALLGSFGTACTVTGDGAIALMGDGLFNPETKNLQRRTPVYTRHFIHAFLLSGRVRLGTVRG